MPTLSPTLIGTFFVSIALQVAALSLLPITQGFSRLLPTIALIVLFVAGIGLLAGIIATGVPLSILLPVSAAVVPLAVLAVGVTFYGEHALLLIAACGLIGVASIRGKTLHHDTVASGAQATNPRLRSAHAM